MIVLLGVMIGAALGLLGGGGSILTVPVFVYLLGYAPKDAIAMSLAVVGATSVVGVAEHWRAGRVNLRVAAWFGAAAMAGTYAGTQLAVFLSGGTQLIVFAVVMLVAAVFMGRGGAVTAPAVPGGPLAGAAITLLVAGGVATGLLTGLVGVGGGFLIVPALVLVALPMCEAVGTSLLIITANSAVGLLGYLGHVELAWPAVALMIAGTAPGIWLGARAHRFVPQAALRRTFAAFLVAMGIVILYQHAGPALSAITRTP